MIQPEFPFVKDLQKTAATVNKVSMVIMTVGLGVVLASSMVFAVLCANRGKGVNR